MPAHKDTLERMLIAQITDLHIVDPATPAYGHVDTCAYLQRAIDKLNRLSPQPDLIIATGDLTDHGTPAEYALLRAQLCHLNAPTIALMGNHDERGAFRDGLTGFGEFPNEGFIHFVYESRPVRVIALDSTRSDSHKADFCDVRARWLEAQLAAAREVPTIVALHHPPFDTGIAWMDGKGAAWARPLIEVLTRHPQVVRIICGHMHRPIFTEVGGRLVSVSPSVAHQVALDLSTELNIDCPPEFEMEPPGFQLHAWDGRRLRTHTAHIEDYSRFAPFSRAAFQQLLKAREGDASTPPSKIMF